MAETFTLISTYTVPASQTICTITFTAIPQTYTDLMLLGSLKTSRDANNDFIKGYFNADTTDGNYTGYLNYNGASNNIAGGTFASLGAPRYFGDVPANNANATNWFSGTRVWIHGYTDSYAKSYGAEGCQGNNGATQLLTYANGRWSGTAPITDISFTCGVTGPWREFSTISLYGIKGSN